TGSSAVFFFNAGLVGDWTRDGPSTAASGVFLAISFGATFVGVDVESPLTEGSSVTELGKVSRGWVSIKPSASALTGCTILLSGPHPRSSFLIFKHVT